MATSTALLTDQYELTMLASALRDGTAHKRATFDVFARSIKGGFRYGIVAGLGRILDAIDNFTFDADDVAWLTEQGIVDATTADYLTNFRFRGTVRAIPEGAIYLPNVPVLTIEGTFGECVLLETVILSIVNHDSAVATKAAHIVDAANGKPVMEMGSRRTHDQAAVAAARATYIGGFAATSNLAAGRRYGIPTKGTAAHAWTLAHPGADGEAAAFRAQIDTLGVDTTLLVDTYDIAQGITTAVAVANEYGATGPGAIRIDSGDLAIEAFAARDLLDRLGATDTRIVVSSDLDEDAIAALETAGAPIDGYGVGTRAVAGLTAPGFVYKLVTIEDTDGNDVPVQKKAEGKATIGGRKDVWAIHRPDGVLDTIHVLPAGAPRPATDGPFAVAALLNRQVIAAGLRIYGASTSDARTTRAVGRLTTPATTANVAVTFPALEMAA